MNDEGVDRWRQITEILESEIADGVLRPGQRLPASTDLAARFGVNRHTVLRAFARLQSDGVLRVEKGRGTFVVGQPLRFSLGPRQRLEQNLRDGNRKAARQVLSVANLHATPPVASALKVEPGDEVHLVTMLGFADDVPINIGTHYFPTGRLPGIAEAIRSAGPEPTDRLSFDHLLTLAGVEDFRRRTIHIRSRPPAREEARHLNIAQSEYVLETEVINVDAADTPVVYATTAYSSSRVEFVVDL